MTTTSYEDRDKDERMSLADALLRRREDIEQLWLEEISSRFSKRGVSPSELRDSMPLYLLRLAEGLRGSSTTEAGGAASWENVARQHASERVRLGFDIDQLVHEFIVLRRVIFRIVEEETGALAGHQAARIADLIEGAIEASVKSYVQSRDYAVRKREAEHIGFMTHELRNPLSTALLGTKQLLRMLPLSTTSSTSSSASSASADQQRIVELVERNLSRTAELIDAVLLVERDAYALEPQPRVLTMKQVLDEPLAAAKLAAEAKGLVLQSRFDPDLVVEVDPKLTMSALDNVLQNAVKYSDAGDVQVVVDDEGSEVVLHVRDSCAGISTEELQTIFEPFRRASSRTPGTGLGLAIARRAIEAQGGTIHAEAGDEKGCHFWLTFRKAPH